MFIKKDEFAISERFTETLFIISKMIRIGIK
jgi:hypothetical protein